MTKIFVLPDVQCRPEDDMSFLQDIGQFIVDKQPDIIVCLGDFADMASLSSYDVGKKSFEGRRYKNDVRAVYDAQAMLFGPLVSLQTRQTINRKRIYNPHTVMILGNHENRIDRAVNNDAKLEGVLSIQDLKYNDFWKETVPFLEVKVLEGVAFSHYFVTGLAGRPSSTASAQLRKTNMSCISGHQQGLQIATGNKADGTRITSIIAGSCYESNHDYLGPQGNKHWRGCLMLHNVKDGEFDLVPVPLKYIRERYVP